jgi:hypothetical protein
MSCITIINLTGIGFYLVAQLSNHFSSVSVFDTILYPITGKQQTYNLTICACLHHCSFQSAGHWLMGTEYADNSVYDVLNLTVLSKPLSQKQQQEHGSKITTFKRSKYSVHNAKRYVVIYQYIYVPMVTRAIL